MTKTVENKIFIKQYVLVLKQILTAHFQSNREKNNNDLTALKYPYIAYQKTTYSATDSS